MTQAQWTRFVRRSLYASLATALAAILVLMAAPPIPEKAMMLVLLVLVLALGVAAVAGFRLLTDYADRRLGERLRRELNERK